MTVSVFIPNYNHASYLKERIDSVLSQTYEHFELIIMDDCSCDNSREIIELYRDHPKVKEIIFNQENSKSVFKQWQKAIDRAKGKYMWIAESDDYAKPDFLEKMVALLEEESNTAFAYCNAIIVDESGNNNGNFSTFSDLRNNTLNSKLWSSSFKMSGKEFLEEFLAFQCCVNNASAVLFRTSALKNHNVDLGLFKYTGDWAVYADLSLSYDVAYLHQNLSYYRQHANNASKKSAANNIVNYETYTILNYYYNKSLKSEKDRNIYVGRIYDLILPILLVSGNRKNIYANYKKINKDLIRKSIKYLPFTAFNFLKRKMKNF